MKILKQPGTWLGMVAVVFAMSGSAYAAAKITGAQVKDGTITGKDIKRGSISPANLSSAVGTRGPAGPAGPTGLAGPAGPVGPAGPNVTAQATRVRSPRVYFTTASYAAGVTAFCPAGQRVISGGGVSISNAGLVASEANDARNGWYVVGGSTYLDTTGYVEAVAYCAPAGVAVASSLNHNSAKAKLRAIVRSTSADLAKLHAAKR